MHRRRLTEGGSAERLEDLVPRYLDAVPIDPFDGKALRLKSAPGEGWTIYSIGEDRIDDGGAPSEFDAKLNAFRGDTRFRYEPGT